MAFPELLRPALLDPLAERGVGLIVAVQPDGCAAAAEVVRGCRARGVAIGLWPLLFDTAGRWASGANLTAFCRHAAAVLDACAGDIPDEMAIDLEPPIAWVRRALSGHWRRGTRRGPEALSFAAARRCCRALVGSLGARGVASIAAIPPMVVCDGGRPGWQRLLATPVDGVGFDRVSAMAYTSLLEGYSRRLLRRADARALLADIAVATRRRFGSRAALSLGVVGGGALGTEAAYRSAGELADDAAIARGAGIDHLAAYGLSGMLARPPLERWLDALAGADTATPAPTRRSRLAWRMARSASPALDAALRARGDAGSRG